MESLRIKQRIIVPDDIRKLGNILAIEAVRTVSKNAYKPFSITVDNDPGSMDTPVYVARPGDELVEIEGGIWFVEDKSKLK